MNLPPVLFWLFFVVCLGISFVLSGMEAGVFALSRLRIRQQMRAGRKSASLLHHYLENSENFLWTILVGNTVANFFILGWLVIVLQDLFPGSHVVFGMVYAACVFLFYTGFDLLPKMLFRLYPNRLTLFFARPFRLLHFLLRPLVTIVERVSGLMLRWRGGKVYTGRLFGNREELRQVMQESAQGLTSEERVMINRVLDLPSLTVRQIMTPMAFAVTLEAKNTVGEALDVARQKNFTRLPAWDEREGRKRIVGLVNINTLLYQTPPIAPGRPLGPLATPALYLDEDQRLEIALRRMQRSGQRLAIVLSRERREIGIIGIQDVLKVIFGEMTW